MFRMVRESCLGVPSTIRSSGVRAMLLAVLTSMTPSAWADAPVAADPRPDCLIEPRNEVKVSAGVAGVLRDVLVDRGDIVHRGQLVAQLDDTVEVAAAVLAQARAQDRSAIVGRQARLAFLTRKRDRLDQLRAKGAGTVSAYDEADSDFRQATQDVEEAESNLRIAMLEAERTKAVVSQKSILSPVDGVVVTRSLYRGEYAYEQAPIMTVAQIDPLAVQVYLPVAEYPNVHVGLKAKVDPADPVGGSYEAEVDVVDNVFDARSGTFGVRLALPNPSGKLPAGLRCKMSFASSHAGNDP